VGRSVGSTVTARPGTGNMSGSQSPHAPLNRAFTLDESLAPGSNLKHRKFSRAIASGRLEHAPANRSGSEVR
jgi:hypothetical protein